MSGGPDEQAGRGREALLALVLVLAAWFPSLGTLRAPWIAEDAAVLARVAAEGVWADWNRPWFGMEIVRFWRPLVTLSWGAQHALSGIEPLPLRLFNLALHTGCVLFVYGIARRLGAGLFAALLAGLWVAWFPEQGGTVTWLSGRTDLLCGVLLLASVYAALGARPWLALPCAFLAASAKEFGFLAAPWCALLACGRGDTWREAVRRAVPAALAAAAAFLWRWKALGTPSGGYAGEWPGFLPGALGSVRALLALPTVQLGLLWLAALGLFGHLCKASRPRVAAAALGCVVLALVPLAQLLGDGLLEPQNARLLLVAWLAGGLLLAGLLARCALTRPRAALLLVLPVGVLPAWLDTHEWQRSAEVCAEEVAAARAALAALEPGDAPALFRSFPESVGGAYGLKFGLAERFRAPFPAATRPVWPWRLLFVADPAREREPVLEARAGGALLPLDDESGLPRLALASEGSVCTALLVDERALPQGEDRSARLELSGAPPGATLEFLIFTELGYEPFSGGSFDAEGRARFTLREVLQLSGGVALPILVLRQAHDLGARRAYLEFRARGADGSVLAASRWIALTWPEDLARR